MFDFIKMKKSIDEISKLKIGLRKSIETKKQKRDKLNTTPLSREELIAGLNKNFDKRREVYVRRLSMSLKGLMYKPFYDYENSSIDLIGTIGGGSIQNVIPKENLMWFCIDSIKKGIEEAVSKMEWDDENIGPPIKERKKMIKKLDKEIENLESDEAKLIQQASAAGLSVR